MAEQLSFADIDGRRRIGIAGRWTMDRVDGLARVIGPAVAGVPASVEIDAAGVESLDLTGAWLLHSLEGRLAKAGAVVSWRPARPQPLAFVDELLAQGEAEEAPRESRSTLVTRPLHRIGRLTVGFRRSALDSLSLLGGVVTVMGRACLSPHRFRLASIVRHVYDTGVTAIPIVALIAFLIAVIVAYIGAQQLRLYGGEIYVADLVTVSVLRELGVLLTAIIVAGRSGSAFAAEIGVMQLNDEVDALRAIGLDPVEVLVVPRVLGLVLALPLLTVVANAMGLAGGALLTWSLVDMPFAQYWDRVNESIAPTTFWAGMIKAPVFAFIIALVATLRGLQVRDSSRELGRLTTVAVVQSIFLVILIDALFAVVYMEIDF
ncbi:MAG: MlaE family lipid ABC transporter permease subunit [Steroidobacteraceae bacterium]|jgi:phospholipid/cholesterol/gamma-HCH transport system permease protein|nr:MlaE family lipid ABC transporter permease subunit [Steroidobacteraceae bacterium]